MKLWRRAIRRIASNESGQAMTEYVIALILAVVPLIIFSGLMRVVMAKYLRQIYFFIGLPIP